jgi:hypothetical protein
VGGPEFPSMLKSLVLALLLTLAVAAKPATYRDSTCEVRFPGAFVSGQQSVSYVRSNVQLYLLSWPTSPGQATTFLTHLWEQGRSRGSQTSFVSGNHANGLRIVETLTGSSRTISQFYVLYGRCYEFRVCILDGKKHPEVDQFFGSIRFRARTVNLRAAILNHGATARPRPAYVPPTGSNPYSF